MLAYNSKDLYNRMVQKGASEAFINGCLDEEGYKRLLAAAPQGLYTPQYLFGVGIAIVTLIAYCFGLLMIGWMGGFSSAGALTLMGAIGAYVALEAGVKQKHFYNAGADNMLMMLIPATVIVFCFIEIKGGGPLCAALFTAIICGWLCIRFADALMAACTVVAIVVMFCLLLDKVGVSAAALPVLGCVPAVVIYMVAGRVLKSDSLLVYTWCLQLARITAVVIMYACSNCLIADSMFTGWYYYGVSGGWKVFYLCFQLIVPVVYIITGIKKLDIILLRTGVLAAGFSAYTFHYYYSLLPADVVLLITGCMLIAGSLLLIRVLKRPGLAFSAEAESDSQKLLKQAEANIAFQVLGKKTATVTPVNPFGGGSSGGAGASGTY
jgi:hypothetical protein